MGIRGEERGAIKLSKGRGTRGDRGGRGQRGDRRAIEVGEAPNLAPLTSIVTRGKEHLDRGQRGKGQGAIEMWERGEA